MRIALVVHDFDAGVGHGRYTFELARRLADRHEVHVWANRYPVRPPGVAIHHVPAWRRTALASVFTFLASAEARLQRQHYDLIHAQGLTCWQADVITAHVCNAARLQAESSRTWRQRLFPAIVAPWEESFYRQARAKHLIAISRRISEEIRRHYRWQRPASVIYHGTDLARFSPVETQEARQAQRAGFGLPVEGWAWLFVGEAVKGLAAVIRQLPQFPQAHLLVISRSDLAPYRRLADSQQVTRRVRFHGPCDGPLAAYQAADVLVYPSAYDAFGLVVAEAMACGLPVVVGRNVGAAEWIQPGQNGLLCDPETPDSLRRALVTLAADPSHARVLGLQAHQTVSQHTWDTCAAQTLGVYEDVRRLTPLAPR